MKKFSFLLVIIVLLTVLPLAVLADDETKELFTLDRVYNMTVSILFDSELPSVSFITPKGKTINANNYTHESGDDWVQYYIPKAEAGTWSIKYDKKSNSVFEINYSSYLTPVSITELALSNIRGDYLDVLFEVTGDSSMSYKYKIFAVVIENNSTVGEKLLSEGYATISSETRITVALYDLSNFDEYYIRLDVWQTNGVEEVYDSQISVDSFGVIRSNQSNAISDFLVEVDNKEGSLYIDWGAWSLYNEYVVAVFDASKATGEPLYFCEITDRSNNVELLFDTAIKSLRVDITGRNYGVNTQTKSKTIATDIGVKINYPTNGVTNSSQLKIDYETPQTITANVSVNDVTKALSLSGSGNFSVKLESDENEIKIKYNSYDINIQYVVNLKVVVDNNPPILRLPENETAINVDDDSFILTGVTEAGITLVVGTETLTVNNDGTFSHTIPLQIGENIVKVVATDMAGNKTEQSIIINRQGIFGLTADSESNSIIGKFMPYLPLIVTVIGSVILIYIIFLISKGISKTSDKLLYILRLCRLATLIGGVICLLGEGYLVWMYIKLNNYLNSSEYFDLAMNSIDSAYKKLEELEQIASSLLSVGIAIVSFVIVYVLLSVIIKLVQKRRIAKTYPQPSNFYGTQNTTPDPNDYLSFTEIPSDPIPDNNVINANPDFSEMASKTHIYICNTCGAKYITEPEFCSICGNKMRQDTNQSTTE